MRRPWAACHYATHRAKRNERNIINDSIRNNNNYAKILVRVQTYPLIKSETSRSVECETDGVITASLFARKCRDS